MNVNILGLAIIAALSVGTANAALITAIDDFTTGGMAVSADGTSTVAASGALGGYRTVTMTKSGSLGATANVLTNPGIYAHSADAQTSAISTITWDANGAGLGGLNWLTGFTNQTFDLDILSIDQGQVDLSLTIADLVGGLDSFTLSGLGIGIQSFYFSAFTGIDFAQVNSLSLKVNGGLASDLTLNALGVYGDVIPLRSASVPEPTVLALLGVGLAVFGFTRRKVA